MRLSFSRRPPRLAAPLFLARTENRAPVWIAPDKLLLPFLRAGSARTGFRGEAGTAAHWPLPEGAPVPAVLAVGLGTPDDPPGLALERAAAAAARLAREGTVRQIAVEIDGLAREFGFDPETTARRLARGLRFGAYRFSRFQTDPAGIPLDRLTLHGESTGRRKVREAAQEGWTEGAVLNEVRDLANLPGNEATPEALAKAARDLARRFGLRCRVLGRAQLERAGFRSLLAVARGSRCEPRLIVLEHEGSGGAARERPLVFVGKTVTFDAGGLSLKSPKGMEWMRYDKSGGMAVLAALAAAGANRLATPAVGILAAVENLPGGNATRPGDIVRSLAGPTIEIVNTDAEGRLLLADTLAWAKRFRPRALVDVATLTGAVIVSLGHEAAAVLSPDDTLRNLLQELGEASGDRLWPLPLWPGYQTALKSPFADVRNMGDGSAGTIAGAAFLQRFVPAGIPWAHLDIAGTAWEEKERPWQDPGATLFGARLLLEWLRTPEPRRGGR